MDNLSFWVQLISFSGVAVGFLWIASKFFLVKVLDKLDKAVDKGVEEGVRTLFLEKQTNIVENVKVEFGKELETFKTALQEGLAQKIEPLRAALSRENIAFQITHTELVKFRFNHLIELYAKAYEIKMLVKDDSKNYSKLISLSNTSEKYIMQLNEEYTNRAFLSSLYLDESTNTTIQKMADMLPRLIEASKECIRLQNLYESTNVGDVLDVMGSEDEIPEYIEWTEEGLKHVLDSVKSSYQVYKEQLLLFKQTFDEIERAIKSALNKP